MNIKGAGFIQFPFMAFFFGKTNKFSDPVIYLVKANIFLIASAWEPYIKPISGLFLISILLLDGEPTFDKWVSAL